MSERMLQRRLEAEATSFGELLDNRRCELAEQYRGRLRLSLAQAAYVLGFADQSSFFRPCGRRFELSGGQYCSGTRRILPTARGAARCNPGAGFGTILSKRRSERNMSAVPGHFGHQPAQRWQAHHLSVVRS